MREKENRKNSWNHLLVGVFAISLFVAFTTGGLAIGDRGGIHGVVNIESDNMMFPDGSIAELEAHALLPPVIPILGGITVTFPDQSIHPSNSCKAKFTDGEITKIVKEDDSVVTEATLSGQWPSKPACSDNGLSGAFILVAESTGSILENITLENLSATIASGTGTVEIIAP